MANIAWGLLAVVALLWPSRLSGVADGIPLDRAVEAIAIGVVFPLLWWLHPRFLNAFSARACIIALLIAKAGAAMLLVQDGWCLAFEPHKQIVRDGTGKPHSWDVRADWRSPDPRCSAVMTRSYQMSHDLPVWFYNLPPPDDAPTADEYRPPGGRVRMTMNGFITTSRGGTLAVATDPSMQTILVVDGRPVEPVDASVQRVFLSPGVHVVAMTSMLVGKTWSFTPSFEGISLGSAGFPAFTMQRPSSIDRLLRPIANWIVSALSLSLLLAWTLSWLASLRVMRFTDARAATLFVGVPFMIFVVASNLESVGRWTVYFIGVDNWSFQRFAYRIYLQGYWLEGGQLTFWLQPLYRWIVGALHLVFGDSSVGQAYLDAGWVIVMALFAFSVVKAAADFLWGLAAAVLTILVVLFGPTMGLVGFGLSEITSAGWIYLAALLVMQSHQRLRWAMAAGVCVVLAFYTRMNNLPMVLAVVMFALPLSIPAGAGVTPEKWLEHVRWPVVSMVLVSLGVGLILFAWRTWHYTGVFSVLHGTQVGALSVWKPGMSFGEVIAAMTSSVMMLITASDPPRFVMHALPLMAGAAISLAALARVKYVRDVPLGAAVFFLSGCIGSLVARGFHHEGRFSVHLIGAGCAVTMCAIARFAPLMTAYQPFIGVTDKGVGTRS